MRIVNLFAGPGTGKSTTAAALFAELKYRGVNCEYIPEFAKDAAWEGGRDKLFAQQDYIFAKQHWRIAKVKDEVDILVTDCPLLMGAVYMPEDYPAPALKTLIWQTHCMYEDLNIFLVRNKPYNPKGRLQNEAGARTLDEKIQLMLASYHDLEWYRLPFSRENPQQIIDLMVEQGWDKDIPAILNKD
jgi:nicotinamide riboside kinase